MVVRWPNSKIVFFFSCQSLLRSKEMLCGLLSTTLSDYYVDCTKVQLLRGLIFKSSYSLKEQRKETHCRVLWGFNSVFFFQGKRLNSNDFFKYSFLYFDPTDQGILRYNLVKAGYLKMHDDLFFDVYNENTFYMSYVPTFGL